MATDEKNTSASSARAQRKSLHIEAVKQMITLATSGFGVVAALAWNNVVKDLVDNYINPFLPKGSGLLSLLLYAIIVTMLKKSLIMHPCCHITKNNFKTMPWCGQSITAHTLKEMN